MSDPMPKRHGERISTQKYQHRRLGPVEFRKLRLRAGVSIRDFMFLSGRHRLDVASYEGEKIAKARTVVPSIADVMILEMIARRPDLQDFMIGIANEYSLGPPLPVGDGG